jgi:hypothetical protein
VGVKLEKMDCSDLQWLDSQRLPVIQKFQSAFLQEKEESYLGYYINVYYTIIIITVMILLSSWGVVDDWMIE